MCFGPVTTGVTATATKTLEATLAPPTAHKEQRLQRTVATYRRALSESFEGGADTQSAVNDVVTGYNLTSYAKDALKNYVPQLRDSYNTRGSWTTTTLFGSRTGAGVSTTPKTERTSSAGASRKPGVAMPSGFHSVSIPHNASCGTTFSTATCRSGSSD